MNDGTPQPKSRRRRWIIAGVIAFVAGFGWWNWPRGDARLVGKWRWVDQDGRSGTPFTLKRNGSGGRPGMWMSWRTSGDRLVLGTNLPIWLQFRVKPLESWISTQFGWQLPHPERRYKYKVLSADRIRLTLDSPNHFSESELQRIPE